MSGGDLYLPTSKEMADCWRLVQCDGFEGLSTHLRKEMEEWKASPLNIGVIGFSGVGKSSFINAVRRLTADDEGAAEVDVNETTTEIREHLHPNNPLLKFWDLPGVGTPKFPQDEYLKLIGSDKFDFFVLLSATRFTEIDAWLSRKITEKKKKYFYVRTKIDDDIRNDKKTHPRTHVEGKMLDAIREATRHQLKELKNDATPLFLIDNYKWNKYDFPRLEERLIADIPQVKRSVLVFSMSNVKIQDIKMKVEELRKRLWKISLLTGRKHIVTLGRFSNSELLQLCDEAEFYKKQLGLDDESLKRLAERTSIDVEIFQEMVRSRINVSFTQDDIRGRLATSSETEASTVAKKFYRNATLFPCLASQLIQTSFGSTYSMLSRLLNEMETVASEVISFALKHLSQATDEDDQQ